MTTTLPPLDETLLGDRLLRTGILATLERLESVGSTNQHLLDALAAEASADPDSGHTAWPHLSVLTAEEQTGGRGRLGRAWSSPKGSSLSTSLVLRPQLDPVHLGWLSMLAGRALVDTLRQDCGLDSASQRAVLKWPNDVQVTQPDGTAKKISGILAAAVPAARGTPTRPRTGPGAVVVGIGINVLHTEAQLPLESATSLQLELQRAAESGQGADRVAAQGGRLRTELLCDFLERFARRLRDLEELAAEAPDAVAETLRAQVGEVLATIGQQVRVELPDGGAARGAALALGIDGGLQVQVTGQRAAAEEDWVPCDPQTRTFSAGDVVHLRPTP
ncbi:biotin--[acetyl-CoA-carboxylase] ligase [Nesterenkonia sp. Act20]|uniref:biotin--[acetyl-CoA-carboxylase] ligase n=1 Tax=Nesterenkonia sp. Act20 TaxID=1483432 RepID=UPI001C46023E|nr:biotin--[acetyl-CoA-carboxylase] ligase [Nesterenkonia sp. Act20]